MSLLALTSRETIQKFDFCVELGTMFLTLRVEGRFQMDPKRALDEPHILGVVGAYYHEDMAKYRDTLCGLSREYGGELYAGSAQRDAYRRYA